MDLTIENMDEQPNVKILIICDRTASMSVALSSLTTFFNEIQPFFKLVFHNVQCGCVLYGDYDSDIVGTCPVYVQDFTSNIDEIILFLKTNAIANGGGDIPEAQKSGFMTALNMMDCNTIVLHFTDAPPHIHNEKNHTSNGNSTAAMREQKLFISRQWSWEWDTIANLIKQTNATIVTFTNKNELNSSYYNMICTTILCEFRDSASIMKIVMTSLQHIMGIESEGVPPFKISFSDIGKKLSSRHEYFSNVIKILTNVLDTRDVLGAIDIFTNKITAEIWRYLLKFRNNDMISQLKNKMSVLANGTSNAQNELKILIGSSFDRQSAFNELIEAKLTKCDSYKCYKAPVLIKFKITDLQTFFSCFSKTEALHCTLFITKMIETIETMPTEGETFYDKKVIPINVDNHTFFSIITHLITTGYIASNRQTAIIALISLNDSRLSDRASEYLMEIKGKWLNFTLKDNITEGFIYPENINMGFILFLLSKRNLIYLTKSEIDVLRNIRLIQQIYTSTRDINTVSAQVACLPHDIITTNIFTCECCKKTRPVSLRIINTMNCVWCINNIEEEENKVIRDSTCKELNVTCKRCNCIYAVMRPDLLKVIPKCHYCRNNTVAPTISCSLCKNQYIYPNYINIIDVPFVCTCCSENCNFKRENIDISVKDILIYNTESIKNFTSIPFEHILWLVNSPHDSKTTTIITKLFRNDNFKYYTNITQIVKSSDIQLITDSNRHVFNSCDIMTNVYSKFTADKDIITDTECLVCYESCTSMTSVKICINKKCNSTICSMCILNIFGNVKAGELIELSTCTCPFCKSVLQKDIAKFHPIGNMKIPKESYELSEFNNMAWCCSCNNIRTHSQRICGETPLVNNFICTQCSEPVITLEIETNKIDVTLNSDRIVTCSNCKSMVCKALYINGIKNYSCNHLKCGNDMCTLDVCGFEDCGLAFNSSGECYEHMTDTHGRWYDEMEEDDEREYDEY